MQLTLKAARVNCGISTSDAANSLGVTRGTINNWESGRTTPTIDMANRICRLYGCNMNDIFFANKGSQ